jgi:hypothetical protein
VLKDTTAKVAARGFGLRFSAEKSRIVVLDECPVVHVQNAAPPDKLRKSASSFVVPTTSLKPKSASPLTSHAAPAAAHGCARHAHKC